MIRVILSVMLCYTFVVTMHGQRDQAFVDSPELRKMLKKGISTKKKGNPDKALKQFDRLLGKSPDYIPARMQKAMIYYDKEHFDKAIDELNRVIGIDSLYDIEIYYSLGYLYNRINKKAEALHAYKFYVSYANEEGNNFIKARKRIKKLGFVIDAMENPVPFKPEDPGPGINSPDHEYLATLDITGELMVFTRRINRQEDLYFSRYIDGKWGEAVALSEINSPYNEAAHTLDAEGKTLYFTKCENKLTYGGCDLFVSKKLNGHWLPPINMGSAVNSSSWDSQPSISADGNTLFFASTRPGGMGGKDIWYCSREKDGSWGQVLNAGNVINTQGNEESPFLHPDGYNLYFMSDGHQGMGGYDLFVAKGEMGSWEQVKNLGYPINTEYDEGAIRVAPDGKTAFFSSDRTDIGSNSGGSLDIYSFELYEEIRSTPVGYVNAYVFDKMSGLPVKTRVSVYDNQTGNWIRDVDSENNGQFILALRPGINYNLSIDQTGYVFHSENYELPVNVDRTTTFDLKIPLIPMDRQEFTEQEELSEEIILKNIFFASGSARLDTILSKVELMNLVNFLNKNPQMKISIEGHTDSVGSEKDNQLLSEQRALAVVEYLKSKGLNSERLMYFGFGENRPVDTNDTSFGRQNNRRTSFKIIE